MRIGAVFFATFLGFSLVSVDRLFAKVGCSAEYSICISRCAAFKGTLDPSRVGWARICHRAKAQCIDTGCFGAKNCGFERN
jgi:hypothetical protein